MFNHNVLVLVISLSIGICHSRCPDAWVNFGTSCYLFSFDVKTFTEAEHFCLQHQAHLVKVETTAESKFLKSRCSELKDSAHWIGLSDSEIEGIWKWTDGSRLDHADWNRYEPNGQHTVNCVALWVPYGYQWADESCSRSYKPICEKPDTSCADVVVG